VYGPGPTARDDFLGYQLGDGRVVDAIYGWAHHRETSGLSRSWKLLIVHNITTCTGVVRAAPCAIHAPSRNHMRDWPFTYDTDTRVTGRMCEHDLPHPDFDHLAYIAERFDASRATHQSIHECCGCCERIFL
jgi:hypothetical protein